MMEEYEAILGSQEADRFIQSLQKLQEYYEDYSRKLAHLKEGVDSKLVTLQALRHQPRPETFFDLGQVALESLAKPILVGEGQPFPEGSFASLSPSPASQLSNPGPKKTRRGSFTIDAETTSMEVPRQRRPRAAKQASVFPLDGQGVQSSGEEAAAVVTKNEDSDLIRLRLQRFRDISMMDAITLILDRTPDQTLHIDELITQMYGKRLGKAYYDRVKHLMSNTLSRGKKANRWTGVKGRPGYYSLIVA